MAETIVIDQTAGWQLCPKCLGSGKIEDFLLGGVVACDVCNGEMILNIHSGKSPSKNNKDKDETKSN